ncbi:MAG: ATP-dependent Clp protease proteolytic subunit, partial [Planctomycetota bacterium]|nr:ATP-dependent Clp protease proteolytic subunit [Planctomycetota bacterium]
KGKRFSLPYARNLMHQPLLSGIMEGQATDLEIEAKEMLRIREMLYNIYSEATGQTYERIASDCERNLWLSSDEMVDYGLCDSILERLPENKDKKD